MVTDGIPEFLRASFSQIPGEVELLEERKVLKAWGVSNDRTGRSVGRGAWDFGLDVDLRGLDMVVDREIGGTRVFL